MTGEVLNQPGKFDGTCAAIVPPSKILIDGGDPEKTLRIRQLLGFVDGQTTNPSLIAKNPELNKSIASGHTLTAKQAAEYRKTAQAISTFVGSAGVSIEVLRA